MVVDMIHFQKRSILHERWPIAGPVDEALVKSSCYLMEAAHMFRIFLKNCMQPRKSNKDTAAEKPNKATIWVAKKFPSWQATVLTTLKELLHVSFVLCSSYSLCRAEIRWRGK
jgi:leucyl-tRNA synthetase